MIASRHRESCYQQGWMWVKEVLLFFLLQVCVCVFAAQFGSTARQNVLPLTIICIITIF